MKRLLLILITLYRACVSPFITPCCRYTPSCSLYAYEAIQRYGAGRGSWLAFKRVMRCHPLKPGGYDPVPDEETLKTESRAGQRGGKDKEVNRCM